MSASAAEQILARAATVLTAAGLSVARGRADLIDVDECPLLNLQRGPVQLDPQDVGGTVARCQIDFDLEVHVAATADVETSADALHLAAHAALLADAQLATWGKASLRCVDTALDQDRAAQAAACLVARYRIDAWVLQRDLSTFV